MKRRTTFIEYLLCAGLAFWGLVPFVNANQVKNGATAVVSFLARNASNLSQYITGLTTGTTNITVYRKNLSALSMTTNTLSEVANGLYRITLNATHTNTTGELVYRVNYTGGEYWGRDEVVDYLPGDIYNVSAAANTSASSANATVNHATYGNSPIYTLVGTRGTSNLSTSDNIGINWGDITNPTTAQGLSGTTISTSQAVASVSGAVGSVTGAVGSVTGDVGGNLIGNVGGNINGSVASVVNNVTVTNCDVATSTRGTGNLTTTDLSNAIGTLNNISAADVWSEGTRTITGGNLTNPQTFNLTGNITGSLSGAVGSVSAAVNINSNQDLTDTLSNITSVKSTVESMNTTLDDVPNTSEFQARTLPSDDYFNSSADPVFLNQTTVG